MKKRLILAIPVLLVLSAGSLQAENMKCGAGKCGTSMKSVLTNSKLLHEILQKDGFTILVKSKKPLVTGNNTILVTLMKEGKKVTDVKVKMKFFMPEMPGMPYMEYKTKFEKKADVYRGVVHFTMGGTWQYHLKFKEANNKVHTVRGSVNI